MAISLALDDDDFHTVAAVADPEMIHNRMLCCRINIISPVAVSVNGILHGELVAELVGLGISIGHVHKEGNTNEGESVLGAILISAVVG
eukprot:1115310-Ditylum_brightwellii.AAC.1